MAQEVINSITNSSQFAADTFSHELDHLRGTVSILVELVRDRIVGYPYSGWQEDIQIPFINLQGNHVYPLQSQMPLRDWMIQPNVNETNYQEHVQGLFDLLQKQHRMVHGHDLFPHYGKSTLSTQSSTFMFQGNCDPSVKDDNQNHPAYYPNCTNANNDASTGGVIRPTTTCAGLEAKAADIGTLLKPIWESRGDLLMVSIHFVNEGAGAMLHFPSFTHHNTKAQHKSYQSIGCDWLHDNINPYTGQPFLTRNLTQNCHPAGTWVPIREYNAMETLWCQDQALNPNMTRFFGPMVDTFFTSSAFDMQNHHDEDIFAWIMKIGRAIFDRHSGEFLGCVAIDFLLNRWTELMINTLAGQNYSNAMLVRIADGTVVATDQWSIYSSAETVHAIEVTDVLQYPVFYDMLKDGIDHAKQEKKAFDDQHHEDHVFPTAVAECTTGRIMSASELPGGDFIYIQAVGAQVFDVIDQLKHEIEHDVICTTLLALLIGGFGMIVLMMIVWTESMILTRPLNWI